MTTKTQPDQWRMQDPPEAFDEPQPQAGEVDEVEIVAQLTELGLY